MMSESISVELKRRGMLIEAGKRTESVYEKLGYSISFLSDSIAINEVLENYLKLRSQFAKLQGTGDNILANHKVAALYIWTLTDYKANQFFLFEGDTLINGKRAPLVTFMYFVIYGILAIDPHDMDDSIQKDLEYCLLREAPENLEWLCLTMHAICRYRGDPTNIAE
jgi:hypothetical protein